MRLLRELLAAMDTSQAGKLAALLDGLLQRVRQHFDFEKRLMAECNYHQTVDHCEAHDSFIKDIERSKKEFSKTGLTHSFRQWAGGRLVSWFRFHIKAYDIGLAQRLRR